MRTVILRVAIALTLLVAAWLSWSEARLAARVADAKQQIATLQYGEVDADLEAGAVLSDYLPGQRRLADDIRIAQATVAYWLGRYDRVTADTNDAAGDAAVLLASANAAFRDAERDVTGTGGPAAVQRLDGVLQAYAAVLKASPRNSRAALGADLSAVASAKAEALAEAAYNYEYVARLRDQVARGPQGKTAKAAPVAPAAGAMIGDLPIGPTIHGRPGGPPPDAKMEDLQMIAPMEYGDREAQPEATPGAKRERKG